MSRKIRNQLLKKLLLKSAKKQRLISAWLALFVGSTLLLLSIMIWSNFNNLLNGQNGQDSLGSSFLTISKIVDDGAMASNSKTIIGDEDIAQIKAAPQIQDVGLLTPANFNVSASIGSGEMAFYTLLFLESAPDRFIDQVPENWHWQAGDNTLPIILSRDFLNMYNYIFAPSQGLPLLSEQSVKALGFTLTMGDGAKQVKYRAQVEGFSDRISSVLVPQSFIEYGNQHFAHQSTTQASRIIVKVADPSNKAFIGFLQDHHYATNAEQLRFSKMRNIVEIVASATGILAFILLAVGSLVFILFIELTLAQVYAAIQLLLQIGYSPKSIVVYLQKKYMPIMLSALFAASLLATLMQILAAKKCASIQLSVPQFPDPFVWIVLFVCAAVLAIQLRYAIKKAIRQN